MKIDTQALLAEIDAVLDAYPPVLDNTTTTWVAATSFNTQALACIERIGGPGSPYFRQVQDALSIVRGDPTHNVIFVRGELEALRADVARGFMSTLQERIHAELFSDYLEMAEYLMADDLKDPAAVLAGGTLEEHLRQLCSKNGIDTEEHPSQGPKPKSAETMNSDLYKAKIYGLPEKQQVTAWYALRNKAAHSKYNEYTKEQIALFIQGLRAFFRENPA
jgi:hypothetical protein